MVIMMADILATLEYYWTNLPSFRYALIVGVLIALCSSLLGVTLVLKRLSFIGDGLSHVAFGGIAIAGMINVLFERAGHRLPDFIAKNNMPFVLAITIICAVPLLRRSQNAKINGDALLAMISVGALALGYLLMNIFANSTNVTLDVCSTLFGSLLILELTTAEVWLSVGLSVAVVVLFVLFYNKIFAVTFDENFSKATGINTNLYNLLTAIVVAVIIVLAMKLVGSLLISALLIFPALSAMRLFKSFLKVTVCSAIVSVVCTLLGIIIATLYGTPIGPTIVAVDIVCFICFTIAGKIAGRVGN